MSSPILYSFLAKKTVWQPARLFHQAFDIWRKKMWLSTTAFTWFMLLWWPPRQRLVQVGQTKCRLGSKQVQFSQFDILLELSNTMMMQFDVYQWGTCSWRWRCTYWQVGVKLMDSITIRTLHLNLVRVVNLCIDNLDGFLKRNRTIFDETIATAKFNRKQWAQWEFPVELQCVACFSCAALHK